MESRQALHGVDEDADGAAEVSEGHLAAGEDRAAGDAELVSAGGALELAAPLHVIGLHGTAAGQTGEPFVSAQRIAQKVA